MPRAEMKKCQILHILNSPRSSMWATLIPTTITEKGQVRTAPTKKQTLSLLGERKPGEKRDRPRGASVPAQREQLGGFSHPRLSRGSVKGEREDRVRAQWLWDKGYRRVGRACGTKRQVKGKGGLGALLTGGH